MISPFLLRDAAALANSAVHGGAGPTYSRDMFIFLSTLPGVQFPVESVHSPLLYALTVPMSCRSIHIRNGIEADCYRY